MGRLSGKIAIISGAAKGLGEADARMFAREGATVILTDVDVDNGQRLAREIGSKAEFHAHDVRNDAEWQKLIDGVVARHGRLDVLVNNAGVVTPGTIETQTEDDYRFVMAVSADGAFFGCKHAVRVMKAMGGGSIVNMSSIASIVGEPNVIAYAAAKGAIDSLTRSVAVHCAIKGYNIRCNSVHPAAIRTPMVTAFFEQSAAAAIAAGREPSPTPKLGDPDDVASTVVFLASDEAKYINGAAIRVDSAKSVVEGYFAS